HAWFLPRDIRFHNQGSAGLSSAGTSRALGTRQRRRKMGTGYRWVAGALLLAGALIPLASCGGSTSAAAKGTRPFAPKEYRIGVEDVLEIAVWREPELSTTAPVKPDGKVSVPVAGELVAVGRTAHELEGELAQKLAGRIANPTVTVVVKEVNASRVFVL